MANRIIEEIDGRYYGNGLALGMILKAKPSKITRLDQDGVIAREETEKGQLYDIADSVEAYFREKYEDPEENRELLKARNNRVKAESSIKESKATIAKLEAKELQGKMFRVEDIKAITEDYFYEIRNMINALPGQLATEVAGSDNAAECAVIIRTGINLMLMHMQQYRFEPARYKERVRERIKWEAEKGDTEDDE